MSRYKDPNRALNINLLYISSLDLSLFPPISTDMLQLTDITYRPIISALLSYRYRYIGFADIGYIGRYLISADTDMPTLPRTLWKSRNRFCASDNYKSQLLNISSHNKLSSNILTEQRYCAIT